VGGRRFGVGPRRASIRGPVPRPSVTSQGRRRVRPVGCSSSAVAPRTVG
jgi:hypothetical protein